MTGEASTSGGSKAEAARLFVALWPSAEAVEHLSAHLAEHRPDSDQLRWQPAHRWHVTLAFVGDRQSGPVSRRLSRLAPTAPGPLRISGSGTFGSVLWLGVAHDGWLTDLALAVRQALGLPREPFRSHLTVARVRGRAGRPAVARTAAAQLADYTGPLWTPEALTLVASVTGPSPRYEILHAFPLRPAN